MIVKRKNSPYIKNIVNIKSLKYSQNSNSGDVFYKRSVPIKGRRLNFLVKNTYYYSRKNYHTTIIIIWKSCGAMSPITLIFQQYASASEVGNAYSGCRRREVCNWKIKKDSLEFQPDLSKMSLLYQMVEGFLILRNKSLKLKSVAGNAGYIFHKK